MEVFISVEDVNKFIDELCDFLQKEMKDCQVKYSKKEMCILYKYFYIYVMDDKEIDLECIREEYSAEINLELMINVYNKLYFEGVEDIVKIINWIAGEMNTDIVLLDEQSHLVFSKVQKEIYYDKEYLNFPFEKLEKFW